MLELENLLAGVESAMESGETGVAALCATGASNVLLLQGPTTQGLELMDRILRRSVQPRERSQLLRLAGQFLQHAGRWSEAREHYMEALSLAREAGFLESWSLPPARCSSGSEWITVH